MKWIYNCRRLNDKLQLQCVISGVCNKNKTIIILNKAIFVWRTCRPSVHVHTALSMRVCKILIGISVICLNKQPINHILSNMQRIKCFAVITQLVKPTYRLIFSSLKCLTRWSFSQPDFMLNISLIPYSECKPGQKNNFMKYAQIPLLSINCLANYLQWKNM